MRKLKLRASYVLCILLGSIFFILLIPITLIQASIMFIACALNRVNYFNIIEPLSKVGYDMIMRLNRP